MNTQERSNCLLMAQAWTEEDQRLQALSDEMRNWMAGQSADTLALGDMQQRWTQYRKALGDHFDNEDRVLTALNAPEILAEVAAVRRQSSRDHAQILARANRLLEQLSKAELPSGWQGLLIESNLLFDVVEQHEEQEAESLRILVSQQIDG